MSQITEEQVKHVALLSKLEFSENEVKSFTDTFGKRGIFRSASSLAS